MADREEPTPIDPAGDAEAVGGEAAETGLKATAELAEEVLSQAEALAVPELSPGADEGSGRLSLLSDVDLHVKVELGRTQMLVEDVLRLGEGSIVELDKLAGDPVDVYVNGRHVARGEVLVLSDNFCIRISEIVANLTDEAAAEPGEGHGRAG